VKSKEVETESNVAESSKVGYGSKKGCFANGDEILIVIQYEDFCLFI
jgi:hypothetical protein